LVNRYSFSGAEDVEFIFAINKSQITNNYSAIRANGVPIVFKIEDDINVGFIILNDV
jgi:hypothetical protein